MISSARRALHALHPMASDAGALLGSGAALRTILAPEGPQAASCECGSNDVQNMVLADWTNLEAKGLEKERHERNVESFNTIFAELLRHQRRRRRRGPWTRLPRTQNTVPPRTIRAPHDPPAPAAVDLGADEGLRSGARAKSVPKATKRRLFGLRASRRSVHPPMVIMFGAIF